MLKKVLRVLFKFFFRVSINGEFDSSHKRTLIIANHSSFIDGILLGLFLPVKATFVVHSSTVQNRLFRFFIKRVDYLTVDPTHPMAIKKVVNLLEKGDPVVIFPEGRITVTGSLMKIYSGASFAAVRAKATIIPIHITGAKHSYFSRLRGVFKRQLFPEISIDIFPATTINVNNNLPVRERRNDAKDKMHAVMATMEVNARKKDTIFNTLIRSKKVFGGNHQVFEDGITENLTFSDLIKKSVGLGTLLKSNIEAKRVGIMLPNSNPCILTFYALQYLGKVPAMINYTAGERAVNSAMVSTKSDTIITSRIFIKKAGLENLIDSLGAYKIIYLEDLKKNITLLNKAEILFNTLLPKLTSVARNYTDEAVVLFTSGSEGSPKGVVHSHESLLTNVTQIKAIYDLTPADKFMICLPTFHVFGLTGGVLLPIIMGNQAFVYPNPLHYRTIPEIIYDRGCTALLGTSTFLAGYARFADPYDFHRLRYVISGAERLSEEVANIYSEKFGLRIMEGYGATETAPVIAANSQMSTRKQSVGRLLPAMTAEIVPVNGIEEGAGKLIVTGNNVMLGYLRDTNPGVIEKSPEVNGVRQYDTGDIVMIDEHDYMFIKGRVKRFAKLGGEMISLEVAEEIVRNISPEHSHAVVAKQDKKKGEALVLCTTDTKITKKQISKSAKELGYTELSVAKDIRIIEKMPLFATGKVNYPKLKEDIGLEG